MADDSFKLTVRIDTDASKQLMKQDIKDISDYLSKLNDNSGRLKIGVSLGNQDDNITRIRQDLKVLQKNARLPRIKLKVEIDEANLTAQLQRIYNITGNASRKGSTSIDQIIFSGTGTGKSVKQSVDVNKIKVEALKKEARLMFTDLEAAFVRLNDSTSETYRSLSTIGTKIDTTNTVRELNAVVDALKAIAQYVKVAEKSTPTFKDLTSARNNFAKLEKQVAKYSLPVDELNKAHSAMKALASVKTKQDFMASPANIAALQSFISLLNTANDHYRPLLDSAAQWREEMKLQSNLAAAKKSLDNWLKENPNVSQNVKLKAEAENIAELFNSVSNSDELLVATNRLKAFKDQCRGVGAVTKTLSQRFKDVLASITFHDVINYAMRSIRTLFRTMVSNVISLDTAMTELKKVTDETDASYRKFLTNAKQEAKNLGVTVSDLVTATADFARLGYNVEDASTLAKAATIYKNVGDGIDDISTASESLISTMQAFGFSADEVLGIVDRFNAVGNSFAISSSGIGAGLLRSASALQTAGNTLEESIALITSANEIVQDPESVGQGLKTIALRIRGAKVELEDAGEEIDGMAESTSKLREQVLGFSGGRLDIMIDADTFKSTYDILAETAELWKELSDIEKAGITELFAGKNRANIFNALMTNWDQAAKAVEVASNAEGSAVAENEKYLESIQGRISKFKAAYESLSDTIMDGNLVKFVVDGGTKIIEVLDKILQIADVLPATLTGTVLALKSIDASDYMGTGLNPSLLEVLGMEMSLTGNKKSQLIQAAMLDTDKQKINEYNTIIKQFGANSVQAAACADEFSSALKKTQVIASNGCIDMTATTQGLKGLYSQYEATTFATKALATATGFLKGALVSLGASLVFTAIIKIGQLLWDNVITTKKWEEQLTELDSKLETIKDSEKQFLELSKRYEELSQTTQHTTEATQEYIDVQNQLKELLPSLQGYYDERGNFIVDETMKMQDLNSEYERYLQLAGKDSVDAYVTDPSGFWRDSQYQKDKDAYNDAVADEANATKFIQLDEKYRKSGWYSLSFDERTFYQYQKATQYTDVAGARAAQSTAAATQREKDSAMRDRLRTAIQSDSEWSALDVTEQQALSELVNSLNHYQMDNVFETYRTDAESLVSYLNNNYKDAIDGIKVKNQEVAKESLFTSPTLKESQKNVIADMKVLQDAVSSLGDAYSEFIDEGTLSAETLTDLQEVFGGLGDEWTEFVGSIKSGTMTASTLSSSFNSLVSSFVEQKALTGDVTEETKDLLAQLLKSIGVTNAEAVATRELAQAMSKLDAQKLSVDDEYLQAIANDEVGLFIEEKEVAEDVIIALGKLQWAKIGASTKTLANATKEEISAFKTLFGLVDGGSDIVASIATGQNLATALEGYNALKAAGHEFSESEQAAFESTQRTYDKWLEEHNAKIAALSENSMPINWPKVSDTTDKVSEEFQKMYDELQWMREANLISEEEYLTSLLALNEKYNRNNLETYRKYALEIFQTMQSMMSDKVTAKYDAQISSLERERDEIEDYYDDQIDAEQEKLDLLKQEWETEEYLLKIEQARAALARAQQQKNVRVYREGQGFVWESDQEEIRNTRTEVNEAIQEYNRYLQELAIEKRIEELEKFKEAALDAIDEQIEAARLAKEEALKNIEELKFGMEAFLEFFEMFGIEVDENILAILENFDLLAQQNGLKDTKKSADELLAALQPIMNTKLSDDSALATMGESIAAVDEAALNFATNAQAYLDALNLIAETSPSILTAEGENWTNAFAAANKALGDFMKQQMEWYPNWIQTMSSDVKTAVDGLILQFKNLAVGISEAMIAVMSAFNTLTVMVSGEGTGIEIPTLEGLMGESYDTYINTDGSIIDNVNFGGNKNHNTQQDAEDVKSINKVLEELVKSFQDLITELKNLYDEIDKVSKRLKEEFQQDLIKTQEELGNTVDQVNNLQAAINALTGKKVIIEVVTQYSTEGDPSGFEAFTNVGKLETNAQVKTKTYASAEQIKNAETIEKISRLERNDVSLHAAGIISSPSTHWALTDEEGPELVIPGQGTFRKLKMGTSILPADISRNLWSIGQNPIGFASGIANMISNRKEENKTYQVNVGDIILHEVQNARRVADELKGLVLKAEQLAYSK